MFDATFNGVDVLLLGIVFAGVALIAYSRHKVRERQALVREQVQMRPASGLQSPDRVQRTLDWIGWQVEQSVFPRKETVDEPSNS